MMTRRWWLSGLVLVGLACSGGGTGPDFDDDDVDARILFIGNSLTYTHDVPRLVRAVASAHDRNVATVSIALPNYALEDHWNDGIAAEIRRLKPDFVVMQQGPSSLPESRVHLVHWTKRLAEVIREVDAVPALYMVWPDDSRIFAFPAVEASYAAAAQEVNGVLLPAGTTWLMAWDRDETIALYGDDGFHPSYLGALAAAYTIYAGLFDVAPATLPALDDNVPAARIALLRDAVAASLQKWEVSAAR
ncbi:MAG TPA: hypothetical protein VK928_09220 [Longimicrobiales bacterium]|nr:hypothetical protein [Longimicrobiales bacterium]